MNILLTGGAGFIGSHVTRALLERGDRVAVIDNFNEFYDPNQKESNVEEFLQNDDFTLFRADITDSDAVDKIVQKTQPELLVHLAARAGVRPSIQNPELYYQVNVMGTVNLLEACRKNNVQRVVFASSSSVYGKQKKIPFSEDDFTENPISPYAATKRGAENICYSYSRLFGLKISCLRFFTVYGPAGRPDMAPYLFTKWIDEGTPVKRFGDGTTKRDYTYVDDIVAGVLAACDNPFDYEIINLGNNKPEVLNDLISAIESILGKKAIIQELPEQPGDVPITYADISKAKRLLNYEPKSSLEQGMERFIKWYKSLT